MEGSPVLDSISRLNVIGISILAVAGILMAYCFLSNRVNVLMFILVLSASLVGTSISVIDSVAPLARWVLILLLLLSGVMFSKIEVSLGLLLFWGYVLLGFISLFRAISLSWQLQRGLLLLMVAIAIPFAYSNKTYKAYELSLVSIAIAATAYSFLNIVPLPAHLSDPSRFSGYMIGAPAFAIVLGQGVPFSFWGLWNARSRVVRIACGLGFLSGAITLIFTGQRAGTITGVIGLIPLVLVIMMRKRNIGWSLFLVILLVWLGIFFVQQSSGERISFLLGRYSLDAGLSDRDLVWQVALSAINNNPLLGQGIGAAEWVVSSSFHNAYLEVWYNAGFFGLVFFVASQVYFFYRIFYLGRISTDPQTRSILALMLGYMLGFAVLCVVESVGAGASNVSVILYLFLGVLVSSNALSQVTSTVSAGSYTLNRNPKVAMAHHYYE
jgi:O-antigen ligase